MSQPEPQITDEQQTAMDEENRLLAESQERATLAHLQHRVVQLNVENQRLRADIQVLIGQGAASE